MPDERHIGGAVYESATDRQSEGERVLGDDQSAIALSWKRARTRAVAVSKSALESETPTASAQGHGSAGDRAPSNRQGARRAARAPQARQRPDRASSGLPDALCGLVPNNSASPQPKPIETKVCRTTATESASTKRPYSAGPEFRDEQSDDEIQQAVEDEGNHHPHCDALSSIACGRELKAGTSGPRDKHSPSSRRCGTSC